MCRLRKFLAGTVELERIRYARQSTLRSGLPLDLGRMEVSMSSDRPQVSTGSGSDLVSDQHAIFLTILDSHGLTRSLPLPVLTRSKCDPAFAAKHT